MCCEATDIAASGAGHLEVRVFGRYCTTSSRYNPHCATRYYASANIIVFEYYLLPGRCSVLQWILSNVCSNRRYRWTLDGTYLIYNKEK
jgi:hypothetical protein